MRLAVDVVKRSNKRRPGESFDIDKLHRSIHAACLSVRTPDGEAHAAARGVTKHVIVWLEKKPVVTSHDLRRIVALNLERYHPEAAYFYQHHRHIL